MQQGLDAGDCGSCGAFTAARRNESGQGWGQARAGSSVRKLSAVIDRQREKGVGVGEELEGEAVVAAGVGGGHVATATAIAITFPGGHGWVAKPKMSELISVQLGSYHTAAAACHPPLHSFM